MFDELKAKGFTVTTLHHAEAILAHDMQESVEELTAVLEKIKIPVAELVRGGGGETAFTQRLRGALVKAGWLKHNFIIKKTVDGVVKESTSHEIDHVRGSPSGVFAMELEWNNKDPFFDRDLENFKRLHSEGAISVGGIITRGKSLQDSLRSKIEQFALSNGLNCADDLAAYYTATPRQKVIYAARAAAKGSFARGWAEAFVADKFGEATTHWRKLEERTMRGVGNPCPLVLIGLPSSILKP